VKTCKIIIFNEVQIKFEGLSVMTRRKLVDEVKFFLPYARHTPAFKLGRWDGMIRFCDIGGRTYLNLLERLLPIVINDGYTVEVEDLREKHTLEFEKIDENTYSHVKWPEGHTAEGQPIVLRDYQVDILNMYFENPQSIQQISTGAGKTILCAILADKASAYGRTVIIVPNKDLVTQTEEDFLNLNLDVGVYFGDRKEPGRTHTICTWQSLEAINKKSRDDLKKLVDNVKCVIVDECFAPGTKVLTTQGYIEIEKLRPGDKVINYSEEHNTFKEDVVVKLHKNLTHSQSEDMYKITLSNGSSIRATGNHKFLTQHKWIRVDELQVGTELMSIGGLRVEKLEKIESTDTTYNLHIQEDHNYVVENVVVANCHGIKADVLKKHLSTTFAHCPMRWAMTGTIPREEYEKLSLICTIGPVINNVKAKSLQDKGVLSNLHINVLQYQDFSDIFSSYQTELSWLTTNRDRLKAISEHIIEQAKTGNTLVLVDRIQAGETLQSLIPDSTFISGSLKSADRKAEYKEINEVDNKVIIATYGVAAVGINIPRIFNLYMIEPGKSFVRVIQTIGRGIRKAKDKDFVNVFDVASTCKYSKRHLRERKRFYKEQEYPFTVTKIKY